jgi:hypothetical protein
MLTDGLRKKSDGAGNCNVSPPILTSAGILPSSDTSMAVQDEVGTARGKLASFFIAERIVSTPRQSPNWTVMPESPVTLRKSRKFGSSTESGRKEKATVIPRDGRPTGGETVPPSSA